MEIEDALKKCNEMYSVGCKVEGINSFSCYTIEDGNKIIIYSPYGISIFGMSGFLYLDGNFCEILNNPINNNYKYLIKLFKRYNIK